LHPVQARPWPLRRVDGELQGRQQGDERDGRQHADGQRLQPIEPGEEGQAALLGRVALMKAGWLEAGLATADGRAWAPMRCHRPPRRRARSPNAQPLPRRGGGAPARRNCFAAKLHTMRDAS